MLLFLNQIFCWIELLCLLLIDQGQRVYVETSPNTTGEYANSFVVRIRWTDLYKKFIYPLLKLGYSRQSGTLSSQRYGKLTGPIIDKAERLQCVHLLIVCLYYLWPSFLLICLVFLYHRCLTNRSIIWNAESVLVYRTKLWGRKIQSLKRY